MSSKGKGIYQKRLRKITTIQIVYALMERPYTFEELREKTHIQRNTLSEILEYFTEKQMVITHKLSIKRSYLDYGDDKLIRIGSTYYIIDFENIDVQRYIADPTPIYLLEYLEDIDHSSDGELRKYGLGTIKKIKSLPVHIFPYDYNSNEIIADVDKDVEEEFLHLKDSKEQNDNIDSLGTTNEYIHLKNRIIKTSKEIRIIKENLIRYIKSPYLELMEEFIKNDNGTPFDFLIYMVCKNYEINSEISSEIYRANLRMTKEFTEDK